MTAYRLMVLSSAVTLASSLTLCVLAGLALSDGRWLSAASSGAVAVVCTGVMWWILAVRR